MAGEKEDKTERSADAQYCADYTYREEELRHSTENGIGNTSGFIYEGVGKSDGKEKFDGGDKEYKDPKDFEFLLTDNVGNGEGPPCKKSRKTQTITGRLLIRRL